MSVTVFYNFISEIKSQLVALTIEKDYRIEWNYLDNEGECINGFFQSHIISTEELENLKSEVHNSFMKKILISDIIQLSNYKKKLIIYQSI
jgi:hypothetical protein